MEERKEKKYIVAFMCTNVKTGRGMCIRRGGSNREEELKRRRD